MAEKWPKEWPNLLRPLLWFRLVDIVSFVQGVTLSVLECFTMSSEIKNYVRDYNCLFMFYFSSLTAAVTKVYI